MITAQQIKQIPASLAAVLQGKRLYPGEHPQVRRQLQSRLPRSENRYSAFVYYSDVTVRTDRLLAYQHVLAR